MPIPPDCEPCTEDEWVCEVWSGPDGRGRYSFTLYWRTDYIPGHPDPQPRMTRGQDFFGSPAPHEERHRGRPWREVDHRRQQP